MTHDEAERLTAVEKYLLNELPAPTRDDFEAHFFECAECAADLRATSAFMEAAKRAMRFPAGTTPPANRRRSWFPAPWRLPLTSGACAALFALVVYQNVVVYPGVRNSVVALTAPRALPMVNLVGGNLRGGAVPAINVPPGAPFLLSLDVPTDDRFGHYACVLSSPNGAVLWHLDISAAEAKDTVAIRVPAGGDAGEYSVLVQGWSDSSSAPPVDLARYRFKLNTTP